MGRFHALPAEIAAGEKVSSTIHMGFCFSTRDFIWRGLCDFTLFVDREIMRTRMCVELIKAAIFGLLYTFSIFY